MGHEISAMPKYVRLGTLNTPEADRIGWMVTQGASGFSRQ